MAAARLPSLAVVVAMLTTSPLVLFLGGDVMTGRGVDQILSQSVDPTLHEPWVQSATTYVELAERASTTDARWLAETLHRECRELGASVHLAADSTLSLRW